MSRIHYSPCTDSSELATAACIGLAGVGATLVPLPADGESSTDMSQARQPKNGDIALRRTGR